MEQYERMTDEQLIRKLRDGEGRIIDYLMEKYKDLVRKEANTMYLLGGENDDLIQEGMIGLFKAVQNYRTEEETSFFSFAKLCIRRQMYSAIKASKRKKHGPLNSYVSIYELRDDKGTLLETMEDDALSNPEDLLVSQEYTQILENKLQESMSDLESRVLYLHVRGVDYRTIAKLLEKSPKTVDNALQRIKNKTEKILENEKESY